MWDSSSGWVTYEICMFLLVAFGRGVRLKLSGEVFSPQKYGHILTTNKNSSSDVCKIWDVKYFQNVEVDYFDQFGK